MSDNSNAPAGGVGDLPDAEPPGPPAPELSPPVEPPPAPLAVAPILAEPAAPAPEVAPADVPAPAVPAPVPLAPPPRYRPNYAFLVVVAVVSLAADLGTKWWAKSRLEDAKAFVDRRLEVVPDHLALVFAKNKGGAWGLLQEENEAIRKPFFLLISVAAIVFIVSLYRRLSPEQRALKWGLPLVLGGALGNLIDRVRYGHVVDFIDFRAGWMGKVNALISGPGASDHWPTFNIADVAIVVGVGLMAVDMFTSRKPRKPVVPPAQPAPAERP